MCPGVIRLTARGHFMQVRLLSNILFSLLFFSVDCTTSNFLRFCFGNILVILKKFCGRFKPQDIGLKI